MKRVSSVVWQFFDRLEENKRCVAVLCKLCDTEYKYFGNTTNLRAHLIKKHPLQWEFRPNTSEGQKEEQPSHNRYEDDNTNLSEPVVGSKRSYTRNRRDKNEVENSETEIDPIELETDSATLNLVRQMHDGRGSDEEWLEEDYVHLDVYEPNRKRKIKREVDSPARRPRIKYIPHKERVERVIDDKMKDEFSVFGEYIANKLRKFKTPKTRGNIQQIISTILWQAEYGLYDDAEAVKRILLSAMQSDSDSGAACTNSHESDPTFVDDSDQNNEDMPSMV